MDTNKASWYLAFGNTTQDQYSSHYLLSIASHIDEDVIVITNV
jgi:hypothetical protein